MTIGIDVTPLTSGHKARGIGVYTKNLITGLSSIYSDHRFIQMNGPDKESGKLDCLHIPYFDPFFFTIPWFSKCPLVVTVHDLIPIVFPKHFPRGFRGNIKWNIQKFLLNRVAKIITDSIASKNDIVRLTGYNPLNIDVIPLAPSPVFRRNIRQEDVRATVQSITDGDPYILYVGDVNWNKNIPRLLSAFRKTSDSMKRTTRSLKLVCVGKAFLDDALPETRALKSLIRDLSIETMVITPGFVSDETLHTLYRGASVTIVPSLYEGFGFPVLEGMASGSVVVSSSVSSLAEIVGPSISIDPESVDSISSGLVRALTLPSADRIRRLAAQKQWVSRFTWEEVARQTVAVYEKIS